jgi:hypothetical protein
MKIIGYYNLDGYRIEDNLDGEVLYEAGNNPLESSSHVDRADGLPLHTIKEYCERTGREMAEELSAAFVGAYLEEEVIPC